MSRHVVVALFLAIIGVLSPAIAAPTAGPADRAPDSWTIHADSTVEVVPGVVYHQAGGVDLKADLYLPYPRRASNPTVVAIHGGGWVEGTRDYVTLGVLPYLERGFSVVNISYRLARVTPAPAAVEDCRCALRWVVANAAKYGFDPAKIVVTGWSAGGHLALTTGMLPVVAGFDNPCPTDDAVRWSSGDLPEVKVAAIVNWFGITDVADLLSGPNVKHYAVEWIGSRADGAALARRVSPLTYVRAGVPPVLTIHGDADPYVPHSHAVRLHRALDRTGVPNRLLTIKKGDHGNFNPEERREIYGAIFKFLGGRGLVPAP